MRRLVAALVLLASAVMPARAQVFDLVNLDHLNGKLHGRVIDFTQNHGADRRICSPILGRPRDLYVYLPPDYDPAVAYPLILFLHGADVDEHDFLDPGDLKALDQMITQGEVPPVIIAAPDGTYEGKNRITSTHSLWVNGLGGRFEDHIVGEIVPFLMRTYSIRPERDAHALVGVSAGGFGAMAIAIKHRDLFGAVATIGGPLNMRYDNSNGRYSDDFDPATYRERTEYDPDMIIARYYFGLLRRRVKKYPRTDLRSRTGHDHQDRPRQPGRPPRVDRTPARRAGDVRPLSRPRQLQLRRPGQVLRLARRPARHCRGTGRRPDRPA